MMSGDIYGNTEKFKFGNTDFGDLSTFYKPPFTHRRTTIIVTLANPNITVVDIQKMMEAGMNVARFLTYYSTSGEKIKLISKVDKAARVLANKNGMLEWPCATCIELKTCIVKTGFLEQDRPCVKIIENSEVTITYDTTEFDKCNEHRIFIDNPHITKEVELGMEISIEEDNIIMRVIDINENTVKCIVTKEGWLGNMETVCLRGAKRTRRYITEKDLELVKLAVEQQVDMIIINYVRDAKTLRKIKKYIGPNKNRPFILSGICSYEGLCNIDDILKETDGLLVARDLLAYEIEQEQFYRMVRIQKMLLGKGRQAGKPTFISGQVFHNMFDTGLIDNQDVSDVTNALLDGASGFILNSCDDTDLLRTVMKTLSNVCTEIEPFTCDKINYHGYLAGMSLPVNSAVAVTESSVLLANESQANIIVIPTVSGRTIHYINRLRPICLVIAVTTKIKTFRLLQIYRGVVPLLFKGVPQRTWFKTVRARLEFAVEYAVDKGRVNYGDSYVSLEKGYEKSSYCDTVRICRVIFRDSKDMTCPEFITEPGADTDILNKN